MEFLKGCGEGVFNAVNDLLKFIWDTLVWLWKNTTDGEVRAETIDNVSEWMRMMKLYLYTEYKKFYDKKEPPFRNEKAALAVAGNIFTLLKNTIVNSIQENYKEFACLNF